MNCSANVIDFVDKHEINIRSFFFFKTKYFLKILLLINHLKKIVTLKRDLKFATNLQYLIFLFILGIRF